MCGGKRNKTLRGKKLLKVLETWTNAHKVSCLTHVHKALRGIWLNSKTTQA